MLVATSMIMGAIVDGDFAGVERMTGGERMSAPDLERAVSRIGGKLIRPPVSSYEKQSFSEVTGTQPRRFETRVAIWTAGQGRTKAELVLRFHEDIPDTVWPEVISLSVEDH
ncbi:MAG TPA: hypothetical protein VG650_18620 [Mycobacteriales bacterium]|nr:hypothetical protein [Mycobacteriales bacterium]